MPAFLRHEMALSRSYLRLHASQRPALASIAGGGAASLRVLLSPSLVVSKIIAPS